MVGGNKAAAAAATPVLRHMGSHIIHCGDHGAGISAKLCNNLVLAASMAALSEALAVGKRLGLDPEVLTDVSGLLQMLYIILYGVWVTGSGDVVVAAIMAVPSEALAVGKRLGLDPEVLTDVSGLLQMLYYILVVLAASMAVKLKVLASGWGWTTRCQLM
jgi:3-hydroxyisobutyrate dehydrogenase-like beta-hydroxyacid dehydrogenase